MDGLTLEEYKEIFKEFEAIGKCPVCLELVQPPVRLCKNGHLICKKCFDAITKPVCCALCGSKFSKITPIDINNLLNVIPRPCENACGYVVKNFIHNDHKYWCNNRIVCCLQKEDGASEICSHFCHMKNIRKHLLDYHRMLLVKRNQNNIKVFYHRYTNTHIIFPLEFQGCLLWNHIKIDMKKQKLLITLQACPSRKDELAQIYIYKIKSCKGNFEFTYTQKVCKDSDEAYNSVMKENCISIPLFMCEFMFDEKGSLMYRLEIEQCQPDNNSTEQLNNRTGVKHVLYSLARCLCITVLFLYLIDLIYFEMPYVKDIVNKIYENFYKTFMTKVIEVYESLYKIFITKVKEICSGVQDLKL